tara:strand:+ start:93 stop:620 length:528 start_codon:yes stop_codon:yes gene_type:complete
MSCAVTAGRKIPCKSNVGGLKAIYFHTYDADVVAASVTAGVVTLPTGNAADFFKYDIKGNSSLETSINSSRENGTTFFESTLNMTLQVLDSPTQEQIKLLAKDRPHVVVEDYNGKFFLLGKEHGCEVTGGTMVTGAAMGDLSGFTLVLTAQETAPPFFCAAAPSLSDAAQIDPNA